MDANEWENNLEEKINCTREAVQEIIATTEKLSVEEFEIGMKHDELMLQNEYAEKGVKAIKTREQLARDDFTQARLLLEDYKELRDELALQCEIQRYVMGI